MKIRIGVVFVLCILITSVILMRVMTYKDGPKFVSPLGSRSYAKVSFPTPTLTPSPTPTLTPTPTLEPTPTPIIASSDFESYFTQYSNEYTIDKEFLKRIANCESGLNSNAVYMNYAGLFQFSEQAWMTARNSMGQNNDLGLRFNPQEAIRTAAFLVSRNQTS